MKALFFVLSIFCTTYLSAQTIVYWEGGTPGKENHWDEARNWSNNQVPNEFTNVIIESPNSGHNAQPVITGNHKILSVTIRDGASLSIQENAVLSIDGKNAYTNGIQVFGGKFINYGEIELKNIDRNAIALFLDQMEGNGVVVYDTRLTDEEQLVMN